MPKPTEGSPSVYKAIIFGRKVARVSEKRALEVTVVGPKGDISFSHQQWQGAQAKEKLVFKSVRPLPGHEFIRIYDGTMAVVNFLANVQLVVDDHDVNLKVRRLEVYHKTSTGWCREAGQGTEVDEKLLPVK